MSRTVPFLPGDVVKYNSNNPNYSDVFYITSHDFSTNSFGTKLIGVSPNSVFVVVKVADKNVHGGVHVMCLVTDGVVLGWTYVNILTAVFVKKRLKKRNVTRV